MDRLESSKEMYRPLPTGSVYIVSGGMVCCQPVESAIIWVFSTRQLGREPETGQAWEVLVQGNN